MAWRETWEEARRDAIYVSCSFLSTYHPNAPLRFVLMLLQFSETWQSRSGRHYFCALEDGVVAVVIWQLEVMVSQSLPDLTGY